MEVPYSELPHGMGYQKYVDYVLEVDFHQHYTKTTLI